MSTQVAVFSNIPRMSKSLKAVFPNICFSEIRPGTDDVKLLKDAEIIVADNNLIGENLYNLPAAKWVQGTWAGVETILKHYDPSKPKPSFALTRFSGHQFGTAMAEYVVANIVNHERALFKVHQNQSAKQWNRDGRIFSHSLIADMNIGILGLGTIGAEVAKILKVLKAQIWGLVRTMPIERSPFVDHYRMTAELPDILQNCDYVINILPKTDASTGLLNGDMLKNCSDRKAVFINIGRGSVIKESDLINALDKEWISAAILDVFEEEPLPPSSPLWSMPQVFITPHVSGVTRPKDVAEVFRDNLLRFHTNQPLSFVVDLDRGY